ncbi:MAG: HAD family hydrolase [Chloroflexota bacterium]
MVPTTIFLDDGGVMNDNASRGPQWQRLVGEYLAPRLGGAAADWGRANLAIFEPLYQQYLATMHRNPDLDAAVYRAEEHDAWLRGMCDEVSVAAPADRATRVALAEETHAFVTRRVRSTYPGVVEAIRTLHAAGYCLHTASGEHSLDLAGYLEGMGVRDCLGTLYGPDLVHAVKDSPAYYPRIFTHADLDPRQALVVDDSEAALDRAASVGAQTALCGPKPPRAPRHHYIKTLADLPDVLTGDRGAFDRP